MVELKCPECGCAVPPDAHYAEAAECMQLESHKAVRLQSEMILIAGQGQRQPYSCWIT